MSISISINLSDLPEGPCPVATMSEHAQPTPRRKASGDSSSASSSSSSSSRSSSSSSGDSKSDGGNGIWHQSQC